MQKRARKVHPKNDNMKKKQATVQTKWDRHARIDLFLSCVFDVEFLQVSDCSIWNMVLKKAIMLYKARLILIKIQEIHLPTSNYHLAHLNWKDSIRTANHDAFPPIMIQVSFATQGSYSVKHQDPFGTKQIHKCQSIISAKGTW